MTQIFIDAWGQEHTCPDASLIEKRGGLHALAVVDEKILISFSNKYPNLAELPGGGIEEGEDLNEALCREIYEETTLHLPNCRPANEWATRVNFYSLKRDKYWNYNQNFWLLDAEQMRPYVFDGVCYPEDAAEARWISLEDLPSLQINVVHRMALEHFGFI